MKLVKHLPRSLLHAVEHRRRRRRLPIMVANDGDAEAEVFEVGIVGCKGVEFAEGGSDR